MLSCSCRRRGGSSGGWDFFGQRCWRGRRKDSDSQLTVMQHFVPLMADFGQDAGSASLLRGARRIKATMMCVRREQIQMKLGEICKLVGSGISNLALQTLRGWNGNKPNAKVTGLSEDTNHTVHFASQTWDLKTLQGPHSTLWSKATCFQVNHRSGAANRQTCDSFLLRFAVSRIISSNHTADLVWSTEAILWSGTPMSLKQCGSNDVAADAG